MNKENNRLKISRIDFYDHYDNHTKVYIMAESDEDAWSTLMLNMTQKQRNEMLHVNRGYDHIEVNLISEKTMERLYSFLKKKYEGKK